MAEHSGIPLDQSSTVAVRRGGFVYDAEPACRAVVMTHEHWAEDDECMLTLFHAIQHAFYGESRDTTQVGMLRDVAFANGIEAEHSDAIFDTDTLRDEAHEDSRLSRRWGIIGLLSLLVERGGMLYQIGRGYAPSMALYTRTVEVLQQRPAPDAGQYICPSSDCGVVCVA